ncbi:DUF5753 domain-containing protein [Streptomyces sp. NPDC059627]
MINQDTSPERRGPGAWADGIGQPDAFDELDARLKGFESHIRSWGRQLAAGHKPVQDGWNLEIDRSRAIYAWEESVIPGMLQTADYARHIFLRYADLQNSVRDTDAAVRSRMKLQEWLYQAGRTLHALVWEAALHALVCPPSVLASQLDRLAGIIGMDTVELGIIPLGASLKIPTANGFWVLDDRLVIAEDWHAELWLDDADGIALYSKVWKTLSESAVYGADAHNVVNSARRASTLVDAAIRQTPEGDPVMRDTPSRSTIHSAAATLPLRSVRMTLENS